MHMPTLIIKSVNQLELLHGRQIITPVARANIFHRVTEVVNLALRFLPLHHMDVHKVFQRENRPSMRVLVLHLIFLPAVLTDAQLDINGKTIKENNV